MRRSPCDAGQDQGERKPRTPENQSSTLPNKLTFLEKMINFSPFLLKMENVEMKLHGSLSKKPNMPDIERLSPFLPTPPKRPSPIFPNSVNWPHCLSQKLAVILDFSLSLTLPYPYY